MSTQQGTPVIELGPNVRINGTPISTFTTPPDVRSTRSVAFGVPASNVVDVTFTIPGGGYPDTAYRVFCQLEDSGGNPGPSCGLTIVSKSATQTVVRVANLTATAVDRFLSVMWHR
jgi:hypothetical protein